jgi:hypothetical protein
MKMAGIDVHKKVLMVVVIETASPEEKPERRRFTTLPSDLSRLSSWLRAQDVQEAVMESTAQYWRTVWLELEPHMLLHLAHAFSNRAPRGRKHDFKDAERLVRRLFADELILSFVPNGEQRIWRNLTRMKMQLTRDRIRLQSQMECLLEEMRIKLSSVVTDLLGASGLRILRALGAGETEAKKLAALGDNRLKCSEGQLLDALTGNSQPMQEKTCPNASTSTPQARLRCRNHCNTFSYPKRNASVMGNFQGSVMEIFRQSKKEGLSGLPFFHGVHYSLYGPHGFARQIGGSHDLSSQPLPVG